MEPGKLGVGGADGPDRRRLLTPLADLLGHTPADPALFEAALTHSSTGRATYERLEFLGDRVLGLLIAEWLYERHPTAPEGELSQRINALVSRVTCARVARAEGVAPHVQLGKQAEDDGGRDSDNILGDVVEALIGAVWLEGGPGPARALVRRWWAPVMEGGGAAQHPKSALQEWAAAHGRRPPVYAVAAEEGPDHAKHFRVVVAVGKHEAQGEGATKGAAERAAAARLLEELSR